MYRYFEHCHGGVLEKVIGTLPLISNKLQNTCVCVRNTDQNKIDKVKFKRLYNRIYGDIMTTSIIDLASNHRELRLTQHSRMRHTS